MLPETFETLLVEKKETIAQITLNRPKRLNALDGSAIAELSAALKELRADEDVRGIILTGAGNRAFAASADVEADADEAETVTRQGQALMSLIEMLGKPVVAAINGYAIGAGCELALACTFRVASEAARFNLPHVRMGMIPNFGATQRLPRLVGKSQALQMILSGDMMDVQEAYRIGLVDEIAGPAKLMERAEALLSTIASNSPLAVRLALEAVNRGIEMTLEDGLHLEASLYGQASASDDFKEGVAAFLERRQPQFKGK